jgi:hypothetical protein
MGVNTAAMVARRRFGEALKAARLKSIADDGRPVKQITVANALGRKTIDRYSRLERGEAWPDDAEWDAIARVLDMSLEDKVRLETMLREGQSISVAWWNEFEKEFAPSLIQFVAYEDAATRITTCAGLIVPGLLQTPDYGRAVTQSLASSVMTGHMVERSVQLRINRRGVFKKANPPAVEAIFSEGALLQEVGGRQVMLEQLDSLIEDNKRRNVSYRIIPFTAAATSMYMFTLFEFGGAEEKPVASFDAMAETLFRESLRETRELKGYTESLRALALSPMESLEKLKTIRKEMSRA